MSGLRLVLCIIYSFYYSKYMFNMFNEDSVKKKCYPIY